MRRAALPITTFVQAASSAAVIGPTVAAPVLLQKLQLSPAAVGLFVALVYLGAMFATQIGAYIVRRWGPIRSSQAALLCGATGLLLLASPILPLSACGAVAIGLGYGPSTPASSQMTVGQLCRSPMGGFGSKAGPSEPYWPEPVPSRLRHSAGPAHALRASGP